MGQQTCTSGPTVGACGWTVGLWGKGNPHLSQMGVQHFYPLGHLYDFSMGMATVDCPVKTSIGAQWCNRGPKSATFLWPHMVFSVKTHCGLFCVFPLGFLSSLLCCFYHFAVLLFPFMIVLQLFCPSFPHTAITLCQVTLAEDSRPQVYKGPLGGDWSTWGTCLPIFCDYADCQEVTTVQCTNYFFSLIGTTCSWYSSSLRGL